jgi:hypothetical protein
MGSNYFVKIGLGFCKCAWQLTLSFSLVFFSLHFALEGDGFPMLTVTFNSQCVTDRVKLSGYRKFWLVKEKAEKKFKISITHIHFKFKTKYPATKTKKKKTISGLWST